MSATKKFIIAALLSVFAALLLAGCGEAKKQYGQLYKKGDSYYVRTYNPDHKDKKPKKGQEDNSDWFIWYLLVMPNNSSLSVSGMDKGTSVALPSGASWKALDEKPENVTEDDAVENDVVEVDENGEPAEEVTENDGEIADDQVVDESSSESDVSESFDNGGSYDSGGSDDGGSYDSGDSGGDFGGGGDF